jgi:hypothetical protein
MQRRQHRAGQRARRGGTVPTRPGHRRARAATDEPGGARLEARACAAERATWPRWSATWERAREAVGPGTRWLSTRWLPLGELLSARPARHTAGGEGRPRISADARAQLAGSARPRLWADARCTWAGALQAAIRHGLGTPRRAATPPR